MNPNQQQEGINWQLISNAIAEGIIPAPAGSNENGEPYWVFNDQRITWNQVQDFVLQAKQKQTAQADGGSIESMPQMPVQPNFEAHTENASETRVETSPERAPEKQPSQEQQTEPQQTSPQQSQPQSTQPKQNGDSFIGQSAPLSTVDPSDPESMLEFSSAHKNDPVGSSSRFLAEFLDKVLQVLSL